MILNEVGNMERNQLLAGKQSRIIPCSILNGEKCLCKRVCIFLSLVQVMFLPSKPAVSNSRKILRLLLLLLFWTFE